MMYDIEKSIGFLLAKTHQRGFGMFKDHLDAYGLTPPQFSLLAFLWREDGLSQAELCERTAIDRTTMGGLIDRLEKDALVKRMPHPEDRRAYRIFLTERGAGLREELCEVAGVVLEKFLAKLDDKERGTLRSLLEKLRY